MLRPHHYGKFVSKREAMRRDDWFDLVRHYKVSVVQSQLHVTQQKIDDVNGRSSTVRFDIKAYIPAKSAPTRCVIDVLRASSRRSGGRTALQGRVKECF
jgi:hypothetical protein